MIGRIGIALLPALVATSALASDLKLRYGFDFGGEMVARVDYLGGGSDLIRAGDGEYAEIGYQFQTPLLDNSNFTTELAFGYKYDFIYASNFEADFDRWTATLTQYYNKTNPRVGIGITRHFGNTYQHSGRGISDWQSDINIAHGLVLALEYEFRSSWNIGGRLTQLTYTDLDVDLDANSAGLFVGYTF
jgi:hypothetical protein